MEMHTKTGNLPIGLRRGWSKWQHAGTATLAQWARDNGFAALDLMNISSDDIRTLRDAGLSLGSVDLLDFGQIMSSDASKRKEVLERNLAAIALLAPHGAKLWFTCVIPGDPTKPRNENYKLAVECFSPIAHACAKHGASLAIEGWPGMPPYYANLCCTPETMRAFIKDVGPGVGVNYDPSHLIRLGVDHLRFLKEFAPHVKHVHAKDTELFPDALYELGTQASAFAKSHGFGEWTWRYTIPGKGCAKWQEIFTILKSSGYKGIVSVELEDENFNDTEAAEKRALAQSLEFLSRT